MTGASPVSRDFVMVTVSILSDPDHKYGTECAEMVRVSAALQPLHQNMSCPLPSQPEDNLKNPGYLAVSESDSV